MNNFGERAEPAEDRAFHRHTAVKSRRDDRVFSESLPNEER